MLIIKCSAEIHTHTRMWTINYGNAVTDFKQKLNTLT